MALFRWPARDVPRTTPCYAPACRIPARRVCRGLSRTQSARESRPACSRGVGARFMEFRKFLALGAEPLVLREVPVENVHLHGFHAVQIAANHFERDEMARGIHHQTAPRETRLVLNRQCWCRKSVG